VARWHECRRARGRIAGEAGSVQSVDVQPVDVQPVRPVPAADAWTHDAADARTHEAADTWTYDAAEAPTDGLGSAPRAGARRVHVIRTQPASDSSAADTNPGLGRDPAGSAYDTERSRPVWLGEAAGRADAPGRPPGLPFREPQNSVGSPTRALRTLANSDTEISDALNAYSIALPGGGRSGGGLIRQRGL
jgi:hypothetical protein